MFEAMLDTTVLIDLLRGHPPAVAWLQAKDVSQYAISIIVRTENLRGAKDKLAFQRAARLMRSFETVYPESIDFDWALEQQVRFQLSHRVEWMDCLIAASAHRLGVLLYSHNLKHLSPLLKDQVIAP